VRVDVVDVEASGLGRGQGALGISDSGLSHGGH
jgi:hypothetical protein